MAKTPKKIDPAPPPPVNTDPLPYSKIRDLRGQRFGKLFVYAFSRKRQMANGTYDIYWKCWCDCGTDCEVTRRGLLVRHTKSCGCLNPGGRLGTLRNQETHQKRSEMIKRVKMGLPPVPPTVVEGDPAVAFAQDSLLAYACLQWAGYRPAAHHRLIAQYLERVERGEIKRLMITTAPRHGKALHVDTLIPTPDGFKKISDLVVGDTVFDEQGNPTQVVAKSDVWKDRNLYKVKTQDGESVLADEEHEWVVRLCRKTNLFSQKTTKQLYDRQLIMRDFRAPMLATNGALVLPEKEYTIHPYVLGVWLGDGNSREGMICSDDQEIIDRVVSLEGGKSTFSHKKNNCTHLRIGPNVRRDIDAKPKHSLQGRLRVLNLLQNKHIPQNYLRGSIEQRIALLQGLIDTDGYVSPSGEIEFCSTSYPLALGTRELLYSLGVKCSMITGRAMYNGKDCGEKYRIIFYFEKAASLTRKAKFCRQGIYFGRRFITIEPAERGDTVCIQVSSQSHQFLCGTGFIPTHNSMLVSEYFPAWYLGKNPNSRFVCASYGQDLASDFGRKVRNQIADPLFQEIFPDVKLAEDSAAVDKFNLSTPSTGGYFAVGVGGALTGRGATCLVIDDPVRNREDADSESTRRKVKDWYTSVAYTRLMDQGSIIICQTRWHTDDLSGWLLKEHKHENWVVLNLPAINDKGEPLWPEKFPLTVLEGIRRTLPSRDWQALYQQQPFIEEGGILKRQWWKIWPEAKPLPDCTYIIQSWDTAFSDQDLKRNSYSARTTWGVFKRPDDDYANLILLEAWRGHVDYHALRKEADKAYKEYQPDKVIIEKKASGQSLIQDLRRAGLPIVPWTPEKDKVTRAYGAQSLLENGRVYYPNRKWAEDMIEECCQFPQGSHNDFVDTLTQAFLWVQRSWLVRNSADVDADDPEDEDELPDNVSRLKPKRKAAYG